MTAPSALTPSATPTPDATKALQDRLNRWEADGTLDRVLSLLEGAVGIADATSDRMVGSAGAGVVSGLAVLDTIAQDPRAREGLIYLLEKLGEWKETGALETVVALGEGLVGLTQATTDSMVAEAGGSLLGGIRFIQALPPRSEVEPLLTSFRENGPAIEKLFQTVAVLQDPRVLEAEMATIPPVNGIFSLGRALRDPEIRRGLRTALVLLKQLGKVPSAPAATGAP